jgi:ribosomal protein L37AE/L43A
MTTHECPTCGAEMENERADHDVGIIGGWVCMACGRHDADEDDDDVHSGWHDGW